MKCIIYQKIKNANQFYLFSNKIKEISEKVFKNALIEIVLLVDKFNMFAGEQMKQR